MNGYGSGKTHVPMPLLTKTCVFIIDSKTTFSPELWEALLKALTQSESSSTVVSGLDPDKLPRNG